jgi:hypothetical protein
MSLEPDILGFTADQIGLHSARSGTTVAMYLVGVPVFTIMLLGRRSSDALDITESRSKNLAGVLVTR